MDEKKLLKVVDQRLINHYSDGNTDWMHKAEESIAAVMRVGLSCVAHHPNDTVDHERSLIKIAWN